MNRVVDRIDIGSNFNDTDILVNLVSCAGKSDISPSIAQEFCSDIVVVGVIVKQKVEHNFCNVLRSLSRGYIVESIVISESCDLFKELMFVSIVDNLSWMHRESVKSIQMLGS